MLDDFSNYPPTIGEVRSDRTHLASDWAPRDALIALLRDIDSGKVDVDALVIAYRYNERKRTSFLAATPDGVTTLGLLERAKFCVHESTYHQ